MHDMMGIIISVLLMIPDCLCIVAVSLTANNVIFIYLFLLSKYLIFYGICRLPQFVVPVLKGMCFPFSIIMSSPIFTVSCITVHTYNARILWSNFPIVLVVRGRKLSVHIIDAIECPYF